MANASVSSSTSCCQVLNENPAFITLGGPVPYPIPEECLDVSGRGESKVQNDILIESKEDPNAVGHNTSGASLVYEEDPEFADQAKNWSRGSELKNSVGWKDGKRLPQGQWHITVKYDGKRGYYPGSGKYFYSSSGKRYSLPSAWVDRMPKFACDFEIVADLFALSNYGGLFRCSYTSCKRQ